jgi:signal peptidase
MSPTYKRGDAIIYEKINVKELKVGDILAFQKNSIVVTHRIVEIWKQDDRYYFTTKGDNNNTNDNFITKKDVVGKLVLKLKVITFISFLLSIPYTWIIIFIFGIIYIWFFSKYKVKDKKMIDKEVL